MEDTCVKETKGEQEPDFGVGELLRDVEDTGEGQSELKPV